MSSDSSVQGAYYLRKGGRGKVAEIRTGGGGGLLRLKYKSILCLCVQWTVTVSSTHSIPTQHTYPTHSNKSKVGVPVDHAFMHYC